MSTNNKSGGEEGMSQKIDGE